MRFGQLGAPLFTPVFRLTLNGRPPWNVAMLDSCQPPKIMAHDAFVQHRLARAERQLVDAAEDEAVPHVEAGGSLAGVEVR